MAGGPSRSRDETPGGWPTIAFSWQLWGSKNYTDLCHDDSIAATIPALPISLPSPVTTAIPISPTLEFETSSCAPWNERERSIA